VCPYSSNDLPRASRLVNSITSYTSLSLDVFDCSHWERGTLDGPPNTVSFRSACGGGWTFSLVLLARRLGLVCNTWNPFLLVFFFSKVNLTCEILV